MRILACSDLHGDLPKIQQSAEMLLICGDFSPLELQCYHDYMMSWIDEIFLPWIKSLNVEKVVFIAGNHDFVCAQSGFKLKLKTLLEKQGIQDKVIYLCNDLVDIVIKKEHVTVYGTPYVHNCTGWAFALPVADSIFANIPKCDILLTHQPPAIASFGSTYFRKRGKTHKSCGNHMLARVLSEKEARCRLSVFGHIHTGRHTPMTLPNGCVINNVSLKDESYNIAFPVWYYNLNV